MTWHVMGFAKQQYGMQWYVWLVLKSRETPKSWGYVNHGFLIKMRFGGIGGLLFV